MVVALVRDLRGAWRDMVERKGKSEARPLTRFLYHWRDGAGACWCGLALLGGDSLSSGCVT